MIWVFGALLLVGLMLGFSCCCCAEDCEACFSNEQPDELTLVISAPTEYDPIECGFCEDIAGTYIVQKIAAGSNGSGVCDGETNRICKWEWTGSEACGFNKIVVEFCRITTDPEENCKWAMDITLHFDSISACGAASPDTVYFVRDGGFWLEAPPCDNFDDSYSTSENSTCCEFATIVTIELTA